MSVAWNDIREAVVTRLAERHPDVTVTDEEFAGEPTGPRCFVRLAAAAQARLAVGRYRRTATFDIRYAAPAATLEQLHGMAESLYNDLFLVAFADGGSMRGDGMSHEIAGSELRFAATFVVDVVRPRPAPAKMGRLLVQEGYPV
ncbi:DUF6838 family protein [Paenibacillus sp.]|uniref:phage tail terminator family protein n=1 Tax=Paenibacillus sp. TaxID=58172 RepID=UPI002811EB01|nr:hypothetical protein [Paenibacillus sp.]